MVRSLAQMPAQRGASWWPARCWSLGPAGEEMHRDCGRHMAQHGMDLLLGVRGLARRMVEGAIAEAAVRAEFVKTLRKRPANGCAREVGPAMWSC